MNLNGLTQPPLLTAVTCVLQRRAPLVAALDHIAVLLDAFLDISVHLSLDAAAKSGVAFLFDRVLKRTLSPDISSVSDETVTEYRLSKALEQAVGHGHIAIVQRIHAVYTQPLFVRLLRLAADRGHLPILQWLLAHRTDGLCIPEPIPDPKRAASGLLNCCMHHVYQHAINNKHLHVIRWLFEAGYVESLRGAGDTAALAGDLDTVCWVHAQNVAGSFSASAIDSAVRAGRLDIVQFLIENRSDGCTSAAINDAILGDRDDILQLLRASGISTEDVPWALVREAGELGRLDILKWDHYAMHDARYLDSAMSAAAENGHLHVVQWLARNRGTACRLTACARAAGNGHLQILKWVNNEGNGEWGVDIMDRAAQSGQLEIVEWLHRQRSEGCSTFAMDGAAANGHLEVVQWLHTNRSEGCTTGALDRAAANGYLETVQWLHANRTEGCSTLAMDRAASFGHLHIVEWLHANRSEGCSRDAMDSAAAGGHLDMVMWLHTHRTEGCSPRAMDAAPLHILKWLHYNRTEGCTTAAMNRAATNGDLPMLEFLRAHRNEGCTASAAVQAARRGHTYIVQWLQERYPDMYDADAVTRAVQSRTDKVKRGRR
jgi:hypothetical protein